MTKDEKLVIVGYSFDMDNDVHEEDGKLVEGRKSIKLELMIKCDEDTYYHTSVKNFIDQGAFITLLTKEEAEKIKLSDVER